MPPKQLMRATCLLLLSAAVFGRAILSDEVTASISSAVPMASLPAQMTPAAVNCVKQFGPNCLWGNSCDALIQNCWLCQRENAASNAECLYCRPGSFKNGVATCTSCPFGHICGGNHDYTACDEASGPGYTTDPALSAFSGRYSVGNQCTYCLPGFGYTPAKTCLPCNAGEFSSRPDQLPCSFCPDGLIANSVSGATDCINPATTLCPANSQVVNNLRSCGCNPGYAVSLPTNAPFKDSTGLPFDWTNLPFNTSFGSPTRMPRTNSLAAFPVGCTACEGNTASSLNRPDAAGATTCLVCPPNSAPAADVPVVNGLATPDGSTCVCRPNYIPRGGTAVSPAGGNSQPCADRGLLCPSAPRGSLFAGGCVPDPNNPPPGTIPTPTPGGPPSGDNNKQEWGHWQHKKHHKKHHQHKHEEEEESEYYSSDKEYEYESDKEKYLN